MKKHIVTLLIILGVSPLFSKNGAVFLQQVEYENIYKSGKIEGIRKKWHANDQLYFESNYKNGEPEGTYTRWYDNGNKEEEGLYRDGKLTQDTIKQWARDGTPK